MKTMTRDDSLLQQEQVERLMQIGAYLHHVREEGALSLEEVSARTLIQPRLLKAIEEGKLHQLPEPVYVQGFIRRYAEALGLEGAEFAEAFPAERSLHIAQSSWKDSPAAQLRPLHLYIAYVALIMASVSLLSLIVGRSSPLDAAGRSEVNTTSQAITPAASQPSPTAANPGQSGATPTRTTPKRPVVSGKPVQVDVKLTAQSWLEVEVDGEVKLAEVLAEGTEQTWTAEQQIRMRAGNAGGVMVAHNGSKPTQMGVPGAVEEKIFAPTTAADAKAASSNTLPQ